MKGKQLPTKSRLACGSVGRPRSHKERSVVPPGRIPLICLALAAVTIAVYSPVVTHPFVNFDDFEYLTDNSYVNGGLNWQTVKWAMTATTAGNWHPLTWISHALDYRVFGANAGGHHATSLLLHVANVVLLFWLLLRATGARGPSLVTAALFALHPLNVESVAWAAERKNVLCTLFFLLALGAYGWYAQKPNWKRYACVAALFVLGLASKPMVITLPFILLLLDFWPLGRIREWSAPSQVFPVPQESRSRLVLEKLPLLALSAASAFITFFVQRSSGAVQPLSAFPFWIRIENSISSYAMYVVKAIWPSQLAVFYPYPAGSLALWQVLLALVFLLSVTALVWKKSSLGYPIVGWFFFLGTLIPVIGIVQVGEQSMADRYAYIPLLGLFVMAVWGTAGWVDRQHLNVRIPIATATIILVVLSFLTWRQVGYWRSSLDLWAHTINATKDNFLAERSVGDALVDQGDPDDALPHYLNASRINPRDAACHVNIGGGLQRLGRLQEASGEYETAIRMTPDVKPLNPKAVRVLASSYANLGTIYRKLGDDPKALESYKKAGEIDPLVLNQLLPAFSQLVEARPSVESYLQLGELLQHNHRILDAERAYWSALQLDPQSAQARQALRSVATQRP